MAGSVSEESEVGRSMKGISSGQRCQSGEALVEWRSSEQVESGIPLTFPPYWDSDDDDDGSVSLKCFYGCQNLACTFSFNTSSRCEGDAYLSLHVPAFHSIVCGGSNILINPQGCDVCNHLSLFLCVANHDKLLPGWSHFAQFAVGVVNRYPKKSKYSDTLHQFWKEEHDWCWKKFMELSEVSDGLKDGDTLITIKAQVQVIRLLKGSLKSKKTKAKLFDAEDMPAPIVHVENDMFVLVDAVLLLLERAALEPLPTKDEKGPQNRTYKGIKETALLQNEWRKRDLYCPSQNIGG